MSEVKRFDFGARDADGSTPMYVRASDYTALEERCAGLSSSLGERQRRVSDLERELARILHCECVCAICSDTARATLFARAPEWSK